MLATAEGHGAYSWFRLRPTSLSQLMVVARILDKRMLYASASVLKSQRLAASTGWRLCGVLQYGYEIQTRMVPGLGAKYQDKQEPSGVIVVIEASPLHGRPR